MDKYIKLNYMLSTSALRTHTIESEGIEIYIPCKLNFPPPKISVNYIYILSKTDFKLNAIIINKVLYNNKKSIQ